MTISINSIDKLLVAVVNSHSQRGEQLISATEDTEERCPEGTLYPPSID